MEAQVNFYCIGDGDTVRGFRLAGVEGQKVETAQEAGAALDQACARHDAGIIIITQQFAAAIREQIDAVRLERAQPLILEIPGPEGPLAGRKTLRQLMQQAVGITLNEEGA